MIPMECSWRCCDNEESSTTARVFVVAAAEEVGEEVAGAADVAVVVVIVFVAGAVVVIVPVHVLWRGGIEIEDGLWGGEEDRAGNSKEPLVGDLDKSALLSMEIDDARPLNSKSSSKSLKVLIFLLS